ncbi:restriction endonuclease subunit S [Amaricoccus solimangrovi]|uniref:restriction endonuclease subunit S n=1 Tax=Amaricoccus solimangrovi TaxID=2589815 RepID=UPI0015E485B9|nr:restriction endonuclease subunit S [Amaricoccus solimangrovi]
MAEWILQSVRQLQNSGILFVEDGNHGEYRPRSNAFVTDGVPFVRPPDLVEGRVDLSACDKINDVAFARVRKGIGRGGDVLFTHRATVGRLAMMPIEAPAFVCNPGVTVWRALKPEVLSGRFLYYWMHCATFMDQVWAAAGGADTFPYIGLQQQRQLLVAVPPSAEQQAIARILGALDNKIELNRRMNRTLEEMARALFRSWFVDFDPVHAKAEGRAPAHMDPATATLFPARFGEDGLPEGWRSCPASRLVEFNPRERLGKGEVAPYFDMKALPTSGPRTDVPIQRAFTSGTKFRNGDVLLARITPCLENGKTALVDAMPESAVGWGSTEFIVMRGRGHVSPGFVYCLARDDGFRECAIQSMVGSSGRQRVQNERVETYGMATPDDRVFAAFAEETGPQFALIGANGAQIDTLAALRDTLLPKLMSGEVRERLDLLAFDKEGQLVVIENKLDDTGRDVVWQALKYAAYVSTPPRQRIVQIFQSCLGLGASLSPKLDLPGPKPKRAGIEAG